MSGVVEHLKERRKAELQGIHQFWFPGESMVTTRDELERRLAEVLKTGAQLRDRIARLSRTQTTFLEELLGRPDHTVECAELFRILEGKGIAQFESESAARMLTERGFVTRLRVKEPRSAGAGFRASEVFQIPDELAVQLADLFDLTGAPVAPEDQLSQKRLPFEVEISDLDAQIESLPDPHLASLARLALDQQGLVGENASGVHEILEAAHLESFPPTWRESLEESGIGTIGTASLKDFGIVVDEPALIIFQEWISNRSRDRLHRVEEPDTVVESGIDLYTDIDRLAVRLEMNPTRLTREGKIPKRGYDSLREVLSLPRLESHLDVDLAETVMSLALLLGIVETYGDLIRIHPERLRVWRKLDLTRQVEIIQTRFQSEHQGNRWSFHQEALRQILIEMLEDESPAHWVSLDALVSLVVSTYLLELEERDVRGILRQRREEDFARERLNSPYHRLASDLTYWIVSRFLILGVCELGYRQGRLESFRLTPLGKEILGLESDEGENRVLVNPNFEIILFCEGLRGMQLERELARFGERLSAERIRRYRVTRDTIRLGIRSGLSLEEIRKLLEGASDHPLPDPVLVSLRDWGKDLDWVEAKPAIVLQGLKASRARELSELLKRERCRHQICPDHTIVIPRDRDPKKRGSWESVLERLREEGWLIRSNNEGETDSQLEDLEPRTA